LAALPIGGLNVTQANGRVAGQVVPHLHFHVIPRSENDGVLRGWKAGKYESDAEMAGFAERIGRAVTEA
jgi:histidine triad (HIT) family protein